MKDHIGIALFLFVLTIFVCLSCGNGKGRAQPVPGTPGLNEQNLPPSAKDDSAVTAVNIKTIIHVLMNDTDDRPGLSILSFTQPQHGTVTLQPNGAQFCYAPDETFIGFDSFTYTVIDPGGLTDEATVDIQIESLPPAEISVSYNGNPVLDGQSVIEVGPLSVNQMVELSFIVNNAGPGILLCYGLTPTINLPVTDGILPVLGPGESDTFQFVFQSANVGVFTELISFNSNDSDETPFNFTIQVTVAGADPNSPSGCSIVAPYGLSGMAPFTVHVNALDADCDLKIGNPQSARYEWNFGDESSGSEHNTVVGYGAAHTYRNPGLYTIQLFILNEQGFPHATPIQATVNVAADSRLPIYVSQNGNDANNGSSPGSAIKTISKLNSILADHRTVLFQAGQTFNASPGIKTNGKSNLWIKSYGPGDQPTLMGSGGSTNYSGIVELQAGSQNVILEDLSFDSPTNLPSGGTSSAGRGVLANSANAKNITIRNINFGKLGEAVLVEGAPSFGFFLLNNSAGALGRYFYYADSGSEDSTLIGNTALGSYVEHVVRVYTKRIFFYENDFINPDDGAGPFADKSVISLAGGQDAFLAQNRLRGYMRIGYSAPNNSFSNVVLDSNYIEAFNQSLNIMPGSHNVFLRNNIFWRDGAEAIGIWETYTGSLNGFDSPYIFNLRIINNTFYSSIGTHPIKTGPNYSVDPQNMVFANNLAVLPPSSSYRNVKSTGSLAGSLFQNNVWQLGVNFEVGGSVHTLSSWNALPQVATDTQDDFDFAVSDDPQQSNEDFFPPNSGNVISTAQPFPGVFRDYYGKPRASTGSWTAGAVEIQ